MMAGEFKMRAGRDWCSDYIELALWRRDGADGRLKCANDVTLVEVGEGVKPEPFLSLSCVQAQALMDSLWDCGLRPTEGAGSAGALAATQGHLADMRKLVEKAMEVKL